MFFANEKKRKKKELDRLKSWLVLCEAYGAHMESVNAYYTEHGTVKSCAGITESAADLIDDGIRDGTFPDNLPFSSYDILNNYYEIQRLKRQIEELSEEVA